MTKEDIEARIARLRAAPRHVKAANTWATLVGLTTLLRACTLAYAGHVTYGKALLFGCLLLVWFCYCGFSLLNRSRWGFVVLAVLAALPLFGVFAAAVHLLRLLVEGKAGVELGDALIGIAGLCQLLATCLLFRHLLAAETRTYIWKKAAE
jgi:hypothetical protein